MSKRILIAFIAIASVFILNGCTSYTSPNKPIEQLASVRGSKPTSVSSVTIKEVNNQPVISTAEKYSLMYTKNPNEVFTINPGKCTLVVEFEDAFYTAEGSVEFNAQQGKSYQVKSTTSIHGKVFKTPVYEFFIIDISTGKKVSK